MQGIDAGVGREGQGQRHSDKYAHTRKHARHLNLSQRQLMEERFLVYAQGSPLQNLPGPEVCMSLCLPPSLSLSVDVSARQTTFQKQNWVIYDVITA